MRVPAEPVAKGGGLAVASKCTQMCAPSHAISRRKWLVSLAAPRSCARASVAEGTNGDQLYDSSGNPLFLRAPFPGLPFRGA
jgi:hypothetical protein